MSRSIQFTEYGAPSVLTIVEIDEPHAGPGQVRVKTKAAGLNPVDHKIRSGAYQAYMPVTFPATLGNEYAGIIDEVGDGVTEFSVGDEVFGSNRGAALAEYQVVDQAAAARRPENVPWPVAASLQVAGTTAWNSVNGIDIAADDTVLVTAAAGGVGSIAAQLAVLAGATVIGTASEANHDYLRSLGVIPVTYGPGLVERISEIAPNGITAVLENNNAEGIEAGIALGVPLDRINSIVGPQGHDGIASNGGSGDVETLTKLADLVSDGSLVFTIDTVFPFEEVVAAYEQLEKGHTRGKLVLEF